MVNPSLVFSTVLCWCLLLPLSVRSQAEAIDYAEEVQKMIMRLRIDQDLDARSKSDLADSVFQLAYKHSDICTQIQARILQATELDNLGLPDSALTQLYWSRRMFQHPCDSLHLMNLFGNMTNVLLSLGEFDRIDSVSQIAIRYWNPEWIIRIPRFQILNNLAIAQASRGDMNMATTTFHQAYAEARADGNEEYIQKSLLNLGTVKGMSGDLDSATYFLTRAANYARQHEDVYSYMTLLVNLSNIESEKGDLKRAASLLDSAYNIAERRHYTEILAKVQKERAQLYARKKDYTSAYEYLSAFIEINDQYLNEERVKAVADMAEKYESEKKARQIQQLEIDKLDANIKNERVTNARNRFIFIGAGVMLIAIALYSRLHYVRRSKAAIQKEKDVSEGLLLNILPAPVAEELKAKGHAEARHFDDTTILFSDFKGFTTVSEILTAPQLVDEINTCFKTFDEITTKYGIEKIKTIGDAYMAVGGLHDSTSGIREVVLAALDMQQFINARKRERDAQGLPAFSMRVGIHTGPVVAGIVGKKKFQYDLWGDTVNIASRMESHGETGHVNISEATYARIKDDPAFRFIPRGTQPVKGKGEMPMYFVEPAPGH